MSVTQESFHHLVSAVQRIVEALHRKQFCSLSYSCFCLVFDLWPRLTPDNPLLSLWFFQAWTLAVWAATSMTRSPVQWPSLEPCVPSASSPLLYTTLTIHHSIIRSPSLLPTCASIPETTSLPFSSPPSWFSDNLRIDFSLTLISVCLYLLQGSPWYNHIQRSHRAATGHNTPFKRLQPSLACLHIKCHHWIVWRSYFINNRVTERKMSVSTGCVQGNKLAQVWFSGVREVATCLAVSGGAHKHFAIKCVQMLYLQFGCLTTFPM